MSPSVPLGERLLFTAVAGRKSWSRGSNSAICDGLFTSMVGEMSMFDTGQLECPVRSNLLLVGKENVFHCFL